MKKILMVALIAIMALSIVACAPAATEDSALLGTWSTTSLTAPDGTTVEGDALVEGGYDLSATFEAGGVLTLFNSMGEQEGTWTQDGSNVTMVNGSDTNTGALFDDLLEVYDAYGNTFVMEKQ